MSNNHIPVHFFDDFARTHITIIGDVMLDRYWYGATQRISPEAPVPIVQIADTEERPGGAGNVALNVSALSANTTLVGACGADQAGDYLEDKLTAAGIHPILIKSPQQDTILKLRVISQHQQLIRLDFEHTLKPDIAEQLKNVDLSAQFAQSKNHVMILSDYGKGSLPDPQYWIKQAEQHKIPVLVDPKGHDFARYQHATLLTPNIKEFEAVMGPCEDEATLIQHGMKAIKQFKLQALLITRGQQGMTLLTPKEAPLHLPAHAHDVFDVTGAGDTVIATVAVGLAAGMSMQDAARLANIAASVAVSKLGAATVSIPELRRTLHDLHGLNQGVLNQTQLQTIVSDAKAHGEKIVMTNGCFDILHAGHVAYLQQAKALGHRLIVAINDDDSVSRLKGPTRPINTLARRITMLAELTSVDWVVPFSEDTPADLIAAIAPDVLVKGGDYTVDEIPGADSVLANQGEVKVLAFIDDLSTTKILDKLDAESV